MKTLKLPREKRTNQLSLKFIVVKKNKAPTSYRWCLFHVLIFKSRISTIIHNTIIKEYDILGGRVMKIQYIIKHIYQKTERYEETKEKICEKIVRIIKNDEEY